MSAENETMSNVYIVRFLIGCVFGKMIFPLVNEGRALKFFNNLAFHLYDFYGYLGDEHYLNFFGRFDAWIWFEMYDKFALEWWDGLDQNNGDWWED